MKIPKLTGALGLARRAAALAAFAVAATSPLVPTPGRALDLHITLLGNPGGSQMSTPIVGSGGLLYGTSSSGGANGTGLVFKANADGSGIVPLHAFAGLNLLGANADGANPLAQLVVGADGKLYGCTQNGGSSGTGTIFSLAADGSGFQTLHAFAGALLGLNAGGANPLAKLTVGADGLLYGACPNGGSSGLGTLFRLATNGSGFSTLHNFTGGADGGKPLAGLTLGADNGLYGTAKTGGANGLGVVFHLLGDGSLAAVHAFSGADGSHPLAGLTVGQNGNLLGTTSDGGANNLGAVFSVAPDGTNYTTLASLNATTGANPSANLTLLPSGDLLGTTTTGGANGAGTIAQVNLAGDVTPLFSFPTGDSKPTAISIDADGLLHAGVDVGGTGMLINIGTGPQITSLGVAQGTLGQPFSFPVTATGAPAFTATGLPTGLSINATTGLISGTPTAAGTFGATVTATNLLGSDSEPLSVSVQAQGPGLTVGALPGAQVGVPYSFQVTANGAVTAFSATGLPTGLSINPSTGLIVGVPTAAGAFNVALSATGPAGLSTGTFPIAVLPAAPVITSPAGAVLQVNAPFSYQITASNNPVAFTATGLPAGLTLNATTGLISGTPTQLGVFPIAVTATNAGGVGDATVSLNVVTDPNTAPPVITIPATITLQVGVPFSYQIMILGNYTSIMVTGLPPGLTFDPVTGIISGIPTQSGSWNIVITATGPNGTTANPVKLDVGNPAATSAPVVSSATSANAQVGVPFTYQITASNNPTGYGAIGLPDGLAVNTTTGLISGTPTTAGNYSAIVSASNAGGTGQTALALPVSESDLPAITIVATKADVTAESGDTGMFKIIRTGDTSAELIVRYETYGDAVNGVDYVKRKGTKKIKAGKDHAYLSIIPQGNLDGGTTRKVRIVIEKQPTYRVGDPRKAKVFIHAAS